ncbi:hypothetical protein ACFODL_06760 [Phenylobacterium terrae]|uniref:hypothetical protein n=1 Tax=Phenylobacterium terrae TaxID=2665495 RepID=UPI003609C5CB
MAPQILFPKASVVFNVEQVAGLPGHFYAAPAPRLDGASRIAAAETFFAVLGADICTGDGQANCAVGADHAASEMPRLYPRAYEAVRAGEINDVRGRRILTLTYRQQQVTSCQ